MENKLKRFTHLDEYKVFIWNLRCSFVTRLISVVVWTSDPISGTWTGTHVSLGAMGDSFYEYLIKSYIQSNKNDTQAWRMYTETIDAIEKQYTFLFFYSIFQLINYLLVSLANLNLHNDLNLNLQVHHGNFFVRMHICVRVCLPVCSVS